MKIQLIFNPISEAVLMWIQPICRIKCNVQSAKIFASAIYLQLPNMWMKCWEYKLQALFFNVMVIAVNACFDRCKVMEYSETITVQSGRRYECTEHSTKLQCPYYKGEIYLYSFVSDCCFLTSCNKECFLQELCVIEE